MPRVDKIFVIKTNELKKKIRGVINMKRNRYKEVVKLYKDGMKDTAMIAEKLNINRDTVRKHINEARKNGDILPEKSLYEQVIEQYNSGIRDVKQIAINTQGNERTISNYIGEAKKKGRIEKRTSYEEVVKLCNTTDYSLQEIAEELGLNPETVRKHYVEARKQQQIQREIKRKNKNKIDFYDQTIKLNQQGINNTEISMKLKITERRVERYLIKYSIEQRKKRQDEEYNEVLKSLRNGIYSVGEISKITRINEKEVRRYIKLAKNKKDIELENSYEQIIKLYNSGITDYAELKNKIGIEEKTIDTYIRRAKIEGKIKQKLSNKQRIKEQYDFGNISVKQISKETGIPKEIVERFVKEYEKEHERKRINLMVQNILSENNMQRIQDKYGLRSEVILKIDELLKKKYPYEVAEELRLSPKIIYDIMDGMNKAEKKRMMESFLINNTVYKMVDAMRKHGVPVNEAIGTVKSKLRGIGIVELADLYYVLGQKGEVERTLNTIIYGENYSQALKQMASEKKLKIKQEFKNQEIRAFYMANIKEYGTKTSYDVLCKKFEVRMSLIVELLGKEEICL